MGRQNYKYKLNSDTLKYEIVKKPWYRKLFNIAILLILGFILNYFYMENFNSPWEKLQLSRRQQLINQFQNFSFKIDSLQNILTQYRETDEYIYRPFLEKQTIPMSIRAAGTGGSEPNFDLINFIGNGIVTNIFSEFNNLNNQLDIQKLSYEELSEALDDKMELNECIPAIQPISLNSFYWISSYYGVRSDPFTHKGKAHHGIDFAAVLGTPIYCTGKGSVVKVKHSKTGYGNEVVVDHGFGYKTRYAHLHEIHVKKGDTVERGDLLATLGNSGRSTGPHLHYEVIHNNKLQNPIYYYDDELEKQDYEKIIKNKDNT